MCGGVADDLAHRAREGCPGEDHVRVDGADVAVPGVVEARVERVRLAAVRLVDDEQAPVAGQAVVAGHRLARDDVTRARAGRHEAQRLDEPGERVVGRAVVDDDHLEVGIVDLEQRADGVRHADALVVGGDDDADARREPRRGEQVEVVARSLAEASPRLGEADEHQPEVHAVDEEQVGACTQGPTLGAAPRASRRLQGDDRAPTSGVGRRGSARILVDDRPRRGSSIARPVGRAPPRWLVRDAELLEDERGTAAHVDVVVLAAQRARVRDARPGGGERLPGGVANPPRPVAEARARGALRSALPRWQRQS